ncbi:MAG: saccharopine dehydrogenase NADP-binding domain-containing protein [Steroidobacteraceae bacterium]
MQKPILILGGYGNFGKRISQALASNGLPIVIAGRDLGKAQSLATQLRTESKAAITADAFDVNADLAQRLASIGPCAVINTCGPFQAADYRVAMACIDQGVHYIDLADGRDFVTGITALDTSAKHNHVAVISGASTVPGLSSAVLEYYRSEFAIYSSLKFGISPGQKAERGLATTQGILSYVGKLLRPFPSTNKLAYGWQDLYRQRYPGLGKRWMANCEIPDLDLLPEHYGLKSIQFSAGLELGIEHLGLWAMSWLVRMGLPITLPRHAAGLLAMSDAFNMFGSAHGGMHMHMQGIGHDGKAHRRSWFIIARDGYGPYIPTIPAIVLAKKAARGEALPHGARACVACLSLKEYLDELKPYPVRTYTE